MYNSIYDALISCMSRSPLVGAAASLSLDLTSTTIKRQAWGTQTFFPWLKIALHLALYLFDSKFLVKDAAENRISVFVTQLHDFIW